MIRLATGCSFARSTMLTMLPTARRSTSGTFQSYTCAQTLREITPLNSATIRASRIGLPCGTQQGRALSRGRYFTRFIDNSCTSSFPSL
jgi:hypothetical protein